jgi:hypothetical protein
MLDWRKYEMYIVYTYVFWSLASFYMTNFEEATTHTVSIYIFWGTTLCVYVDI